MSDTFTPSHERTGMTHQGIRPSISIKRQSGVVLVIGLVFLMLMTIVGVTAINNSTLQERMASNTRARTEVFEAAEIALKHGETDLIEADCPIDDLADEPDPDDTSAWTSSQDGPSSCSEYDCEYILTRIPEIKGGDESSAATDPSVCAGFYYVTAKAESVKGMTVVLQSTVLKR